MKILIISDTHDNLTNLEFLLSRRVNLEEISIIIFLGDLVSPNMLEPLIQTNKKIYYVFGNNEGENEKIIEICDKNNIIWFWDYGIFEFQNIKIAITHMPKVAEKLLQEVSDLNLICFGHSHIPKVTQLSKNKWMVNPGSIKGDRSEASFAVYDLNTKEVSIEKLNKHNKHYHFD